MCAYAIRLTCLLIALSGLVSGCGAPRYYSDVPEPEPVLVDEPDQGASAPQDAHVVQSGDSLYSIAFDAGVDWRQIADLNGIRPPYTIYPGQTLRLVASASRPSPVIVSAAPAVHVTPAHHAAMAPSATSSTLPVPTVHPESRALTVPPATAASRPGTAVKEVPSTVAEVPASKPAPQGTTPAAAAKPATPVAVASIQKPVEKATEPLPPRVEPVPERAAPTEPVRPGAWHRPSHGALIARFSTGSQPHKGVDFGGKPGDPVLAAKGGTVVYAGNGVRGYGNLLILKHDATYLSAYAHNSRLLVKEGDVVNAGEKIAEMGNSGTDRVHLHFEVRKQGKPVDPLTVIPKG